MPDWMRNTGAAGTASSRGPACAQEPPEPPAMEAETPVAPDWLSQVMAPEEPVRPVAEPAATQEPELPDWLADLAAARAEPISAGAIAPNLRRLNRPSFPTGCKRCVHQSLNRPATGGAA